ncbi:MAG: asparagine synthase (glutamine-hydrolyzing) [Gemmatimonadetes bacterium]|nr:asparagine synthase (glutamine-hydrolyzing) [Gemmatimonadota bacterium]
MCGIVGIVRAHGAGVPERLAARMATTLRHRGPDDHGVLVEPGVALAHQRLSIIDLATGHQPMTHGDLTVVFNGEIYNYVELRSELRAKGRSFQTTSDTEVLLQLYDEYGAACVARLNGMFAFLLLDRRRGTLLAARDHFGIKPLYWTQAGDDLLFASEIKAFWEHPATERRPNAVGVREYLTFQYVTGTETLFAGVHKVAPAHCMEVDLASGRRRTWCYWSPTFGCDLQTSESAFVEQVQWLLEDAVRLQCRADVPVGAYISGGLDSGIVASLAARHRPIVGFTGRFDEGPAFDESPHARAVASAAGIPLHEVVPTEAEFVTLLPSLVAQMDEPAAGPGIFPQFVTARLAAQHVKVVLGGQGGDEVFGGYVRYLLAYFEQALKGAIFETNEEHKHIVSLGSMVRNLPAMRAYVPMLQEFWRDGLFEPMDRRYFRLLDRSGGMNELLTPEFAASGGRDEVFARFAAVFNKPDTPAYFNKMTHFDLGTSLPALLQVEDRVSMAHGLESRVPLLDHRVVDLVASMPARRKFARGELKYLLKRAVGNVVPASVLDRKDKMGFPVPLHRWVSGASRDFVRETLLSERARHRGLFDPVRVEALLDAPTPFSRSVWGLLNLELWHRQCIDSPTLVPAHDSHS